MIIHENSDGIRIDGYKFIGQKGDVIMKYSYFKNRFFPRVSAANKLTQARKERRRHYWLERSKQLFEQEQYDLAYEYIAMIELSLFLDWEINDHLSLHVWKMFVRDFRFAFSDYEHEKFELLSK